MRWVLFFLGLVVFAQPIYAAETTLTPRVDTTIKRSQPDTRFDTTESLDAYYESGTDILNAPVDVHEALFKFDLTGIPTGKYISNATLKLKGQGASIYGYGDIRLRRVLTDWDETVTWTTRPIYNNDSESNLEITQNNFPETIDITSVVRGWYGGIYPNYGLLMRSFGDGDYTKGLYTGDDAHASSKEGPNPPQLIITYFDTPPSPTPSPGGGQSSASPGTSATISPSVTTTPSPTSSVEALTIQEQTIKPCEGGFSEIHLKVAITDAILQFTTEEESKSKLYYATKSGLTDKSKKATNFDGETQVSEETAATKMHTFTISHLNPDTTYYFTLISNQLQECEHTFKTRVASASGIVAKAEKDPGQISQLGQPSASAQILKIIPQGYEILIEPIVKVLTSSKPLPVSAKGGLGLGIALVLFLGYASVDRGKRIYTMLLNIPNVWFALLNADHKKRRGTWGKVISSLNTSGIPRAVLSLHDAKTGALVDRTSSDDQGFYGLYAPAGTYKLSVVHGSHSFPTNIMPFAYKGEDFRIENATGTIHMDVPMDPAELTNTQLQRIELLSIYVERLRVPILILGSLLALIGFSQVPSILAGALILYFGALWYSEWKRRAEAKYVIVLQTQSGQPIPYVLVQLKNRYGRVIFRKISDNRGRMVAVIPQGGYTLEGLTFTNGDVKLAVQEKVTFKRGFGLKAHVLTLQ